MLPEFSNSVKFLAPTGAQGVRIIEAVIEGGNLRLIKELLKG